MLRCYDSHRHTHHLGLSHVPVQREEEAAAAVYDDFVDSFKVLYLWSKSSSPPRESHPRLSFCISMCVAMPLMQAEEEKAAETGGVKTFIRGGTVMPGQRPEGMCEGGSLNHLGPPPKPGRVLLPIINNTVAHPSQSAEF